MPRQARIVIPNMPHHVTQRGNYHQNVFDKRRDYIQYCEWMKEYAAEYNLDILAYCLMKNHVHFVVVPPKDDTLAKVFNIVHMRYAHYINRSRGVKGHLWQGRFYSCVLGEVHLYRAIRYVERNPVRAKIVKDAGEYEWSSARDHLEAGGEALIRLSLQYSMVKREEWNDYLKEEDFEMCDEIRRKTAQGLVAGTDDFIKRLEKKLNRSLKCLNQGRPRRVT